MEGDALPHGQLTMSESDYERGRQDARLDVNDERHLQNSKRLDKIEAKLEELAEAISVAKGGLRLLIAVGSLSAGLGAFAHEILAWLGAHWK